jgi:hypothetical protein
MPPKRKRTIQTIAAGKSSGNKKKAKIEARNAVQRQLEELEAGNTRLREMVSFIDNFLEFFSVENRKKNLYAFGKRRNFIDIKRGS